MLRVILLALFLAVGLPNNRVDMFVACSDQSSFDAQDMDQETCEMIQKATEGSEPVYVYIEEVQQVCQAILVICHSAGAAE